MLRAATLIFYGITILTLVACEKHDTDSLSEISQSSSTDAELSSQPIPPALPTSAFTTIEWIDLMPEDDLDALLNPPSYVTDVEDGSFEDQISSQIRNTLTAASDDRYQQALVSTRIIPTMDGQAVRIPGFIVPLEFNDEQNVTQFFLVPFFGACIHVPPPPPNQIIFVNYPQGLKLNHLYDPFWISGILQTSLVENDIATAAYSLQMQSYEIYWE